MNKEHYAVTIYIENTRWVSFDIKLPGTASRNLVDIAACRAIQHAFLKPSLVSLISKDANLVFYLSAYQVDSLFKLANMT